MATYCFAERKYALFTESVLRGLLAAFLDWPQFKPYEEYILEANQVPDSLREEVCCIPENDYSYRHLIVHGWDAAYRCMHDDDISERFLASTKTVYKRKSRDEALASLRSTLSDLQPVIAPAWAQYQAAFPVVE